MKPQRVPEAPSEPTSDMTMLLLLLARLRHTHIAFVLWRLSWLSAVAALLGLPVALAVVILAHNPLWGAQVVRAAGVMGCVALLGRLGATLWPRRAPAPLISTAALAREVARLTQLIPALGSSVASAVALAQAPGPAGGQAAWVPSNSLIQAHLAATCRAVREAQPEAQLTHLRAQRLRPWRRACARLLILVLVLSVLARSHTSQLLEALRGQTPIADSAQPLWADVEVRIEPPPYSHLPTLDWAPMGTATSALSGSTVWLRGRADPHFSRGLLAFGDQPLMPWRPDDTGLWQAQHLLQDTGALTVVFIDRRGLGLRDCVARVIQAVPDAPPSATIEAPTEEVVLKDHEQFQLLWRASDDLGIADVGLRVTPLDGGPQGGSADGNSPSSWPVALTDAGQDTPGDHGPLGPGVRRSGTTTLSARALGLTPGAGLTLQVEAVDSAPNKQTGISQPLRVRLFSARAHHEALLTQEEEALRSLVDWLALELAVAAGPSPTQSQSPLPALTAQVVSVAGTWHNLREALQEDTLSDDAERLAIAHVARHAAAAKLELEQAMPSLLPLSFSAQSTLWRKAYGPHVKRMRALERDILYLDGLLAHNRLELLQDHVKDLLAAKGELQSLIARYRDTHDTALRAQLEARMRMLKDQVQGLLQKMAALNQGLPDGFRNQEANSEDAMSQTLARLDQAMASGDVEALAQDLEHMANLVDNAAQQLQEREQEQREGRSAPLRAELQKLSNSLEQLENRQSALQKQSMQLAYRALEEAAQSTAPQSASAPKSPAAALESRLAAIAAQLTEAAHEGDLALPTLQAYAGAFQTFKHSLLSIADAQQLLTDRSLAEAQARLHQAVRLMAPIRSSYEVHNIAAREHLQRCQSAAHAAQQSLDELLDQAQNEQPSPSNSTVGALQDQQRELQKAAQAAQAEAQQLSLEGPVMGEEAAAALGASAQAMGEAADALGAGRLGASGQAQEDALARIRALRQELSQSLQPSGRGADGGMPRPMGAQRPSNGRGQNAPHAENQAEVAIPKAAQDTQDSWREQLMDHAKQPPPKAYEEAVRRYYDGLMR